MNALLTAALAVLFACAVALPAGAAAGDNADSPATWREVRPPDWDFSIRVPAGGELLLAGSDALTDRELGNFDLHWYDPADGLFSGRLFQLAAFSAELAPDELPLDDADWQQAAEVLDELVAAKKGEVKSFTKLRHAGIEWACFRIDSNPGLGTLSQVQSLLLCHAGAEQLGVVVLIFDKARPETIDAALLACLGPPDQPAAAREH